jgi:hypothetical protein
LNMPPSSAPCPAAHTPVPFLNGYRGGPPPAAHMPVFPPLPCHIPAIAQSSTPYFPKTHSP